MILVLDIPSESPTRLRVHHGTSKTPFDIPIEVPYKNATRDVTGITSSTSFRHVMRQIAERMDAGPSRMAAIGYIPSYKPKNPKPVPKLLEDAESWAKLVNDVGQYILSFASKKGAAKTVKPFVIMILDTTHGLGSEKEKEAKVTFIFLFFCVAY